ncbi:hypothetical protein AB3329_01855 [Streptococcus sp. H31]|uniref:hypothetical protein n=1 Tax=Streptococcus huangxiaojuni TaxID=3237239 RepID=UPI0034A3BE58
MGVLKTTIVNKQDNNRVVADLPVDFDELRIIFEERYGECHARDEDDFECYGLSSQYDVGENGETFSLDYANSLAKKLESLVSMSEKYAVAFFEYCDYEDLDNLDDIRFYDSRMDYLDDLYELYGLRDTKFLWTTVDMFLNDDYIFDDVIKDGSVREAVNGIVIEWL